MKTQGPKDSNQNKATAGVATAIFDDHAWNYKRYRYSMLLAVFLYPLWLPFCHLVLPGQINDPLWGRLAVSGVCALLVLSTYAPKRYAKQVKAFFLVTVSTISLHLMYLVALNDVHTLYVMGMYCVMFTSGAILLTRASLMIYYGMIITLSLLLYLYRGDGNSLFLLLGSVTSLAVTFSSSQSILSLLRALHASAKEIETVMNSLGQGFFSFRRDGLCNQVYSQACVNLLEGVPAGKNIADVLEIDHKERENFQKWVELCFEGDGTAFKTVLDSGPKTFPHSKGYSITLQYYPVRDSEGAITEIVVVATDRTREFEARRSVEREQARIKMVATIVEQRALFQPFLIDLRNRLQTFSGVSSAPIEKTELEFRRFLHTIKGGFGLFSMDELSKLVHGLESYWKNSPPEAANSEQILDLIRGQCAIISSNIDAFVNQHRTILGRSATDHERVVELPLSQLMGLIAKAKMQSETPTIWRDLAHVSLRPIADYFQQYSTFSKDLARKQKKRVKEVRVINGELLVFPERYQDLFSSFVHVFRNAIDHGLELPEERIAAGKDEGGTIEIRAETVTHNDRAQLVITIRDDGRGVDIGRLREKLVEKGLLSAGGGGVSVGHGAAASGGAGVGSGLADVAGVGGLADRDVLQMIFEPDFSTRDVVTSVSGRGVGLDALRSSARLLGGDAFVTSIQGEGTEIRVEVPYVSPESLVFDGMRAA